MRIAIIGGGASGLYTAIAVQKKHPDAEVVVFEKETKNGPANFMRRQTGKLQSF